MKTQFFVSFILYICFLPVFNLNAYSQETIFKRQMEYMNRGLIAVKVSNGVFLSWRLLGNDSAQTIFKIYRGKTAVKTVTATEATNFTDAGGETSSVYKIETYVGSKLVDTQSDIVVWANQYKTIKLQYPAGGTTPPSVFFDGKSTTTQYPDGQDYTYTPNDCSVGDLDGDGEYEIIVKWDPSNSMDNSFSGISGNVYIDAYKLDGTMLWRVDLGVNIRAGAHYTQFLVYDFDGNGRAEMVCRTAPGSVDGKGNNILLGSDKPTDDYRNKALNATGNSRCGFVLSGPEYLTLFDGLTGENLHSLPFSPARETVGSWGDNYGNRVDRFLACVAYLDGVRPSAVMCRGYYNKAALAAFDVIDRQLVKRWVYDSSKSSESGGSIAGQGNHNLSVADVDGDGKDEIVYGASAIDDNGKRMYNTGLGHGDAMHLSDLDPDRPGLEVWEVHEDRNSFGKGFEMHDAQTGDIIWSGAVSADNGRGLAADIDSRYRGLEMWSTKENATSRSIGVFSCKGEMISTNRPSINFRIYWDGDLQDELFDGESNPKVTKWKENGGGITDLLQLRDTHTCNTSKATPNISADIMGDWREEVVVYESDNPSNLRIYTTTAPSVHRLYTLMHDPVYRLGVAWQNVAYNQPPHLGFYIGDGLDSIPVPNMYVVKYGTSAIKNTEQNCRMEKPNIYVSSKHLYVFSKNAEIKEIKVYSLLGTLLYEKSNINSNEFSLSISSGNRMFIVKILTINGSFTEKVIYAD